MQFETTGRGFGIGRFEDANGVECSIQKSSIADTDAIWLGAQEIGLKKFTPYEGWEDVDTKGAPPHGITFVANNRMHLTREDVAALLPILQYFVLTGDLPAQETPSAPVGTENAAAEASGKWLAAGPALAKAAGLYVGVKVMPGSEDPLREEIADMPAEPRSVAQQATDLAGEDRAWATEQDIDT